MGLEGEEVYTGWAFANGDNFYSESWSIDMPPSDAFVNQSLRRNRSSERSSSRNRYS